MVIFLKSTRQIKIINDRKLLVSVSFGDSVVGMSNLGSGKRQNDAEISRSLFCLDFTKIHP